MDQINAMGIKQVLSAPRSAWQRAYVERVIGTIRREWLDQVIVFGEGRLSRHLQGFVDCYHRSRTHLGLEKDSPVAQLDAGATEGGRRATGEAPVSEALVGRGRWPAQRKVSVALKLLRGADLETLSRRDGVTAATICSWRDAFLASGEAGLKSRESEVEDTEKVQLKSIVPDLVVSNELKKDPTVGEEPPFGIVEVEAMSQSASPSTNKRYNWAQLGSGNVASYSSK